MCQACLSGGEAGSGLWCGQWELGGLEVVQVLPASPLDGPRGYSTCLG